MQSLTFQTLIRNIWMKILSIRKGFEVFKSKFELFQRDSNHSLQIPTIQKGFEAIECKF